MCICALWPGLQTKTGVHWPGNRLLCTLQTKTGVYLATDYFVPYRETKTGGYLATDYFVPTKKGVHLATDYFVPTDRQRRVCTRQQITLYPTERQRRVGTWQQITLYLQTDKNGCVPGDRLLCTYRQTKTGVYLAGIHSTFPLAGTHHVVGQPVVVAVQRPAHVVVHDGHHALLQHARQHARVWKAMSADWVGESSSRSATVLTHTPAIAHGTCVSPVPSTGGLLPWTYIYIGSPGLLLWSSWTWAQNDP